MFHDYLVRDEFTGADMACKFLMMGWTRTRRYANSLNRNKETNTMKLSTTLIALFTTVAACTPAHALTEEELTEVLSAIRVVESNNNPNAVGDNGNAIGVYQIWKSYWKDATERSGIKGTYKDCYNPQYADKIVRAYMKRYATERRLGRAVTQEDIARIHNGGPNGYKKSATDKYWEKVRKELNR
tara:strand:- start:730 stop:1284 length:555 start_codon:yes stop_codon:yes gene_type:complete